MTVGVTWLSIDINTGAEKGVIVVKSIPDWKRVTSRSATIYAEATARVECTGQTHFTPGSKSIQTIEGIADPLQPV